MTHSSERDEQPDLGNVVRLPVMLDGRDMERPIEPTRVSAPRRTIDLVARKVDTIRHGNRRRGLLRRAAIGTGKTAKYGGIGLFNAGYRYWRWVTAVEHIASAGADTVEKVRARRRTVSYWLAGGGMLGDAMLARQAGLPVWLVPAALLAGVGGAAGIAEYVRTAKSAAGEEGAVRAIGTHPGSKAVRRLFVAAKIAKKLDDVRVVAPGVIRAGDAWSCEIQLPEYATYDDALKKRVNLAGAAGRGVARLYVDPVNDDEGRVRLWSPDRDPLSAAKVDCDLVGRTTAVDVWTERVPIGRTVRGEPMGFSMPGRSLLVGGEPEAGKSVACNILLCFAALDPNVDLWLADGKGVDLLDYEDLAYRAMLRPDPEALLDMINESREDMEEKGAKLAKLRVKKLTKELAQELGWSMSLLHIDELAYFTTHSEFGPQINEALRDHVSRGRYVGKFTSAATQRPSGKVVETEVRDLLSIRMALRCTTPQASDMILGQGWAARGHNAQMIDASQRGACLLFAEGSSPITGRTGFLDDPDITRLSRVAYKLREAAGTLPVTDTHPGRMLLSACIEASGEADKLWTSDLLARLTTQPAWAFLADDPAELAKRLRPYGVAPGQVWISDGHGSGANRQGYTRAGLEEALNRLTRR